ncbi:hypothetical protein MAR_010031 [Mya arenaria]|uniref:Uncharacterized protein n=1 Tax=Mya arenaria TaxID=6604 RepID=A0ABY7E3U8_MYAAR|nr:uncharacterized protein LOC128229720 [Mya arenaria]WAR03473.1 hypothetical protein MAR_010031 [Mya arenaria]
MGDNPAIPSNPNQRKLPIPSSGANTNSALKGILIKPKRILPPQPDSQKLKRAIQETSSEYRTDDSLNSVSKSGLTSSARGEAASAGTPAVKVAVPKLQIDVDRLKSYFQLQGNAVVRKETRKTDLNENDINLENNPSQPPPAESVGGAQPLVLQASATDGLSKVKEWCSSREIDIRVKMTSENKTPERSIRSPSPKSNTTWDRSSSGYSSDERADPRSPPPCHSGSVSVSSKTETEATNEDDVSVSHADDACPEDKSDDEDDSELNNDVDTLKATDDLSTIKLTGNSNSCSADDLLTSENECSALTLTPTPAVLDIDISTSGQCDTCEAVSSQGVEKGDTTSSCVNFSFDHPVGVKKRPVGTALPNPPGNGARRIQYNKSLSESVISLRHPGRQGIAENFDGLEVCGKSLSQASNAATKSDINTLEGRAEKDTGSVASAFTYVERSLVAVEQGSADGTDSPRPRIMRPPIVTCRSPRDPRDPKNLGIVTLGIKQDIRKTLHELSSPRRHSPGPKTVPIRARHPIFVTSANSNQPIGSTDTVPAQPNITHGANNLRTSVIESNPVGMKFFAGKKMWRAPSGQPENAQTRPFSPFGGTLPPAKIKEQEKKRHHLDESD